jgi:DNA-binding Lrp family transcriptional regulator
MSETQIQTSTVLNELDRRIVAALQADPRASWSKLSGAVGVSETTVLRRVNRMREARLLLVTAVPDPLRCGLGQPVHVYFRTVPTRGRELALQLAERGDVRYVSLVAGTHDVMCELIVPDQRYLTRLVQTELPGAGAVISSTTAVVLKQFKTEDQWSGPLLDGSDGAVSKPDNGAPRSGSAARHRRRKSEPLDDLDTRLLTALRADGRRSYADLSHDLGLSETAVARRIAALRADDRIDFLAMVDPAALGFELEVIMHVRVEPARIESAAKAFAATRQVRYVSATTGVGDLTCDAVFRDADDLFEFITHTVGKMRGVISLDTDLVLEAVKRAYYYPLFVTRSAQG